jgi:hypothetical protein
MRFERSETGSLKPLARRSVLAGVGAGAIARGARAMGGPVPSYSRLSIPPSHVMEFQLMRHGGSIGTHRLEFQVAGGDLRVIIAVNVVVRLGPIPLVRYVHHAMETWQGGLLSGLQGQTNKNGTLMQMRAYRVAEGLRVEGSGTDPYIAPPDALPTTYWNMDMLWVPMIGTQDGGLVHPKVAERGVEPVRLASGGELPARCYNLSGDLELSLWYHEAAWVGMRFEVADGSVITYEKL